MIHQDSFYSVRQNRIKSRFGLVALLAGLIMVCSFALWIIIASFVVDTSKHPERVGQFAGKIVNGFNEEVKESNDTSIPAKNE